MVGGGVGGMWGGVKVLKRLNEKDARGSGCFLWRPNLGTGSRGNDSEAQRVSWSTGWEATKVENN